MSPAEHLEQVDQIIERMRTVAVNNDPLLTAACDCFEHLRAAIQGLLDREQADGASKTKFREFL